MSYSLEEKIKYFSIYSRGSIILLQLVFNLIVPDHDAGVFLKAGDTNETETIIDKVVKVFLGGLSRWDGQYFLHIAEFGYTYENTLAFFPLFPLISRYLGGVIYRTISIFVTCFVDTQVISFGSCILLAGILLNQYLFVLTSVTLFKLSLLVLKNEKLAYFSAILFCINPASIFFSAFYSETLYAFILFYALLKIEKRAYSLSSILIGLSALVRSNGLVNIGFICYSQMQTSRLNIIQLFHFKLIYGLLITITPFCMFQLYTYHKFCFHHIVSLPEFIYEHAKLNDFKLPGSNPLWCNNSLPLSYSSVQSQYWNVGLFKYYEFKQIPNFMLAAPVIFLMFHAFYVNFQRYKTYYLSLGLVKHTHEVDENDLPPQIFVYSIHSFALTIFCICFVHIQVSTRMLCSSSPMLYWWCAQLMAKDMNQDSLVVKVFSKMNNKIHKAAKKVFIENVDNKKSKIRTFILTEKFNNSYCIVVKYYFLCYFLLGTFMFSNFLPWT